MGQSPEHESVMALPPQTPTLTHDLQNPSPHVQGEVNGCPVMMLVDTGTAITLIQEKLWKKVGGTAPLSPGKAASAANGGRLEVIGMARFALAIGNLQVLLLMLRLQRICKLTSFSEQTFYSPKAPL